VDNRVGARFTGTVGIVADNRFLRNVELGVRLDRGADLQFIRNNVSVNGEGLVDMWTCLGAGTCSSIDAEANLFAQNLGIGARVHGASSWRDDVFSANRGSGARLGSTEIRGVVAEENEGSGVEITGTFTLRDSLFRANEAHGALLRGAGELRDSSFLFNEKAGLRITAQYVTALHLNVSFNFDGILFDEVAPSTTPFAPIPSLSVPGILGLVNTGPFGADPLDIHRSAIIGNERDAIRAGGAIVNATNNYWGTLTGPPVSFGDDLGGFRNGVSPTVRAIPYYMDPGMTQSAPLVLV
jgi:hypothetical protein